MRRFFVDENFKAGFSRFQVQARWCTRWLKFGSLRKKLVKNGNIYICKLYFGYYLITPIFSGNKCGDKIVLFFNTKIAINNVKLKRVTPLKAIDDSK